MRRGLLTLSVTNLKNPIVIKDTTNNTLSAAGTGLSF